MTPLTIARALAKDDSPGEVAMALYKVLRFEHEFFWGTTKPFPPFAEWIEDFVSHDDGRDT